jgi:hypothetical protein
MQQNLGITIENSWHNMVSKEAQVPVKCVNFHVHISIYLVKILFILLAGIFVITPAHVHFGWRLLDIWHQHV